MFRFGGGANIRDIIDALGKYLWKDQKNHQFTFSFMYGKMTDMLVLPGKGNEKHKE